MMERLKGRAGPRSGQAQSGPRALLSLIHRLERLTEDRQEVSLGDLVREIGSQGHAPLLMVVAILMILPLGMIPGVGGALGFLVAVIGAHMLIGRAHVALPGFVARRSVPAERLRSLLARARPTVRRISGGLRPRFEPLASNWLSITLIAVALILAGLSLMVVGAIPVAAPLLGFPVAVFSVGILARDGAVIVGGWVLLGGAAAGVAYAGQALAG